MRKDLVAVITTVSAVAMISGAGLAAASARPAATTTEHFQGMTTSGTSNKSTVIATGVFTAGGIDTRATGSTDVFTFPLGTFKINHNPVHAKQAVNPKTCLLTITQSGTYKLGGGTGRYAGITGHGTYAISILAVLARNSKGHCSMTATPVAFQQLIKAQGPAKV
jgi:hypothetical protein